MSEALEEFKTKIIAATGQKPRPRHIASFHEQIEVAIAFLRPMHVQIGLCDFETLSGRAEIIEVLAVSRPVDEGESHAD
jgi:hypothetical protein